MIKISGIILTKNSENDIADCLKSIKFCDEIIVIDSGSTDKTKEIAKHYHVKIVETNVSSFAEKRNIGLLHAKGNWLLYVDTDERVTPTLRGKIIKLADNPSNKFQAFRLKRKNFYLGRHPWPYVEKLERLFWRTSLREWRGELHETSIVIGEIGELDGYLEHYTHKDLTSMLDKTIVWSEVESKLRLDADHPKMAWWRFPRVMMTAFTTSYVKQSGWKAGVMGLIESIYQSFSMFVTYARLWEMQINIKNQNAKIKNTN